VNSGAVPKIGEFEEFDIPLEDGSATSPPEPPAAPSLVVLVPREYTWKVDVHSNRPGTRIEFFRKRERP
jgi:hypothetical protein